MYSKMPIEAIATATMARLRISVDSAPPTVAYSSSVNGATPDSSAFVISALRVEPSGTSGMRIKKVCSPGDPDCWTMTLSNPAPCNAVSISSAVAGSENRTSQSVPPVKSMPSFRPEKSSEMSPGTMTTSEMVNHSLRLLASLVIASETPRGPFIGLQLQYQDPGYWRRTTNGCSSDPGLPGLAV